MVIVFLTRLFHPHIGGVEKHVLEISHELIKKGHKVIIITEQLKNTSRHEFIDSIEIYRFNAGIDNWSKKFKIWGWFLRNKQLFASANIVHCHDVFFWYLPLRFILPFKPVYTTFHGYESFPIRKGAIIQRKIAELLSKGNICIGEFIQKWYGTHANYICYGGTKKINPQIAYDKESAIFIGRLENQTGILVYDKAIELIRESYPYFKFTIVGEGILEKKINSVRSVDPFTRNTTPLILSHQFIFASGYLSILEAFAAQRLVFAIYENLMKYDYLTMTPFKNWITVANSPEELAKKVTYFLKNPSYANRITQSAYEFAKNQTWENVTNIYLQLWKI